MFERQILDHGLIQVIDTMGNDAAIVQAARVSIGDTQKTLSDDRTLIRLLMREGHTAPFEQCEVKFLIKMPIFVERQWRKHREARYANQNEISGRYAVLEEEFYTPTIERFTKQSTINKQGSSSELIEKAAFIRQHRILLQQEAAKNYKSWIGSELNREIARTELPLSTYTKLIFKIDLSNLFHFVMLRNSLHAQYEIRVYAEAISEFLQQWVPHAWEAFVDYRLEAVTLSRMEYEHLQELLLVQDRMLTVPAYERVRPIQEEEMLSSGMTKREIREFLEKWQ